MEGKLVRYKDEYNIFIDDKCIATSSEFQLSNCDLIGKLKISHCQKIFKEILIENLSKEYGVDIENGLNWSLSNMVRYAFEAGFKKHQELTKGKDYTEEDMRKCFYAETHDGWVNCDFYLDDLFKQRNTIEVEVMMEADWYDDFRLKPKLDEDGFIIFKKNMKKQCKECQQIEPTHKMSCPTKKMLIQLKNKTDKELKIESILNFVHQSLQWENGEIGGIDMDFLENKLNSIL